MIYNTEKNLLYIKIRLTERLHERISTLISRSHSTDTECLKKALVNKYEQSEEIQKLHDLEEYNNISISLKDINKILELCSNGSHINNSVMPNEIELILLTCIESQITQKIE